MSIDEEMQRLMNKRWHRVGLLLHLNDQSIAVRYAAAAALLWVGHQIDGHRNRLLHFRETSELRDDGTERGCLRLEAVDERRNAAVAPLEQRREHSIEMLEDCRLRLCFFLGKET